MRIIAAVVWALLLVVATTCPLMAGCSAAASDLAASCCEQNSCPREPQHHDDCPYKIRDTRQAEAKFNLALDVSLCCELDVAPNVALASGQTNLTVPATPFAESDRFLTLRVLRI
jgi:hypothetical protein